jgi:GntR family transcriptional regulator
MDSQTDLRIRHDRRPLYIVAKDQLREWVEKGVFKPGSKLPREVELAHLMNVSRSTLREALRIAREEGWILQKHGVGTFVSQSLASEKGLEVLESIDSLCKRRGWTCESADIVIEEREADARGAGALGIEEGVPVVYVARVKVVDGTRAAYIEDLISSQYISLDEMQHTFQGSVLDVLAARGEPEIDYAWTNISARSADERLASFLEVPVGTDLLLAEEILYDKNRGEPFEYSLNYMISGFFNFHIIRTFSSY